MAPSAVPPLMSSDEVNLLVYAYLGESSLNHSAFTLYSESRLAGFVHSGEDNAPSAPPTGQLIRILQKGLLYLQAEAKYRGEDIAANPPRLVGYSIPDALPLPALPKTLPPPSPPAASTTAATNGRKKQGGASNGGNAVAGPSGLKRKEKDPLNNGSSNGGDDHASTSQQQPKKQRTNKSPTGASNNDIDDAISITSNKTADEGTSAANSATAASQAAKNRKGKGKAVDAHGDSEMAEASSAVLVQAASSTAEKAATSSASASTPAPSTTKGPLARALGLAASAASKALPSALKDRDNPPSARRSTSPIVSRKTSLAKDGAAGAEKNRPRSTSPSTSLRTASNNASSSSLAAKNATTVSTPTLDSSKPASAPKESAASEQPKPQPTNILRDGAVQALKGHTMPVQPCHWNPKVESLLATGSGDSTMRIWDVPASKEGAFVEPLHTCKHSSGQRRSDVTAVAWNNEGTLLATGSESGIAQIWTPSGDLHLVLSMHQRTIFSVKWNSSGTMLLTGSLDHSVCMWDAQYGKVKQQWSSHTDSILDLDWMTDDVFASCAMDKNINIHQAGRPSAAYRFKGHTDEVNCIRFDPSKRLLASCSDDNTVRIWSLKAVKGILGLKDEGVKNEAAEDGEIANSDPINGEEEPNFLVLKGHKKEVHAVSWCPKKDVEGGVKLLASASFDSTARLWDASTGNCLHIINRHSDMVYSLAWQPELGDFLATGSNDNKMCVTRVTSSDKNKQYELCHEFEHPGAIYEICWHPTRNQIAICGKAELVNVVNFELSS